MKFGYDQIATPNTIKRITVQYVQKTSVQWKLVSRAFSCLQFETYYFCIERKHH